MSGSSSFTANTSTSNSRSRTNTSKQQGSTTTTNNNKYQQYNNNKNNQQHLKNKNNSGIAAIKTTINNVTTVNGQTVQITEQSTKASKNKRKLSDISSTTSEIQASKVVAGDPDNESDEEIEVDNNETNNFIQVKSRKEKQQEKQQDRIPAIKIRISGAIKNQFDNPIKVQKEIKRCFPSASLNIKFAEYAKYDPNIIVIATDVESTYSALIKKSNWPRDAFQRGIQFKSKHIDEDSEEESSPGSSHEDQVTKFYSFSIKMDINIDIESQEATNEFKYLDICKAVRTIKKSDGQPSNFVRLTTTSKFIYEEYVFNRQAIFFCYQRYYAINEVKPRICWNCQGLGHLAFDCPHTTPTCLQCGENHRVKVCPNKNIENIPTKIFCKHCNSTEHNSASRQCTELKKHVKELIKEKKQEKTKETTQQPHSSSSNEKTITLQQPTQRSTTSKTTYANKVKNNNNNNKQELTELRQQFSDLLGLLKEILKSNLINKITIPQSLQQHLNE